PGFTPAGRGGADGEGEPDAPSAGINPAPHGTAQPGAASATKAALPLLWGRPYAGRPRWGGGRGGAWRSVGRDKPGPTRNSPARCGIGHQGGAAAPVGPALCRPAEVGRRARRSLALRRPG